MNIFISLLRSRLRVQRWPVLTCWVSHRTAHAYNQCVAKAAGAVLEFDVALRFSYLYAVKGTFEIGLIIQVNTCIFHNSVLLLSARKSSVVIINGMLTRCFFCYPYLRVVGGKFVF